MEIKLQLPEDFLEEEIRCGYTVTSEMKKVWAVELDLLTELDRVCQKHNLKYCVAAGTLLGAIRHKGFIPWDDDIDVYMLRDDYERLMALNDEFTYPYFLQNTYTEKNLFRTHAQLRNSSTTGYVESDRYMDINKGIFIDIFPLDGIGSAKVNVQRSLNNLLKKWLQKYNSTNLTKNATGISNKIKINIKKAFFAVIKKEWLFKHYEKNLRKYSKKGTTLWGNRTIFFDSPKSKRPLADWENLTVTKFEFISVPIPENYEEILRQQYGDYMVFPKDIKNGSMHGELVLSTECAYMEYKEDVL